jgi:hypothetical protein
LKPLIDGFVHLDGIDDPVDRLRARLAEAGVSRRVFWVQQFLRAAGSPIPEPVWPDSRALSEVLRLSRVENADSLPGRVRASRD